MSDTIQIEIAYANEHSQMIKTLLVPATCTVEQAIQASNILAEFPEINLAINQVGVFGKKASLTSLVKLADRIEIYRPLKIDPKQARRKRAQSNKSK